MQDVKPRLPRICRIIYIIFAVSAVLYGICFFSASFADFMNRYVSSVLRWILAHLTNWIPFSLAEYLILFLPVLLVVLVRYGIRRHTESWRQVGIYCLTILSILALVLAIFFSAFAPAYKGTTLDQKLNLNRRKVSAQELYYTADILARRMELEYASLPFGQDGFSIMPYGISEMNDLLLDAYDVTSKQYPFLQRLNSRVKPVMFSEAMSYTHITGVYTFFTGEANLNVAFPDYTLPYTAAHELAHQRGIAREDEANFMAFLVCIASDNGYIRYSGYRNLYDHVISALYQASPTLYQEVQRSLPDAIRAEQKAYSDFFEKYRDSVASNVSESVNNAFLVIQGTEGTKSYGMVVDLAVAYYVPN